MLATSIGLYLAEKTNWLPFKYIPNLETTPLIILGSNLIIMVSIIYLSNRNFRQTLSLYTAELETRRKTGREIRKLNLELEQRVLLRTAELEQVNRDLESFSYSISHDLRAPLRAIAIFTKILVEDIKTSTEVEKTDYLNRIHDAALKMDSMITGLLDISRITRENLNFQPVDLSVAVREIFDDLLAMEERPNLEIAITEQIMVQGDERLLRILLQNLIQNAWKFTRDREVPQIEFSSIEKEGETVYLIKDNGVGFDPAYADKLFTPFQRLHSETAYKGYGIGLATCKNIIQRHGGEIWVEAEAGKGATFYFTLL